MSLLALFLGGCGAHKALLFLPPLSPSPSPQCDECSPTAVAHSGLYIHAYVYSHIVTSGKKRVAPDRRVLKKKKFNIFLIKIFNYKWYYWMQNFSKFSNICVFVQKYLFWPAQKARKLGHAKIWRGNPLIFFSLIVPARLFTHRN